MPPQRPWRGEPGGSRCTAGAGPVPAHGSDRSRAVSYLGPEPDRFRPGWPNRACRVGPGCPPRKPLPPRLPKASVTVAKCRLRGGGGGGGGSSSRRDGLWASVADAGTIRPATGGGSGSPVNGGPAAVHSSQDRRATIGRARLAPSSAFGSRSGTAAPR